MGKKNMDFLEQINYENAKEFVNLTLKYYRSMCKRYKITDPYKYFELTDYDEKSALKIMFKDENIDSNSINFVFAQICFHCSNSRRGAGAVVDFKKDGKQLKKFFSNFDPKNFCTESKNNLLKNFYKTVKGVDNFSGEKKAVKNYLNSMHNYAKYIVEQKIENHDDFKNKFIKKSTNDSLDFDTIIKNFIDINKNTSGVGIAFACDFFKDFDKDFSSFSKPDQHVKETINEFLGRDKDFSSLLNYVKVMDKICTEYNHKIKVKNIEFDVTPYVLDRMIYLIKSKNFFLDNEIQDQYLEKIRSIRIQIQSKINK